MSNKSSVVQNEEPRRAYTWNLMSYGNEADIKRLCVEQGRSWAYAKHDRDGNETHTHIVITFEQQKSFATVMRLIKSYIPYCNTMAQMTRDIGESLLYLTHESDQAVTDGKYQYNREIVKYSSKDFYTKYVKGEEVSQNDMFVEDLLCQEEQFSVIKMAKRYGRDFIKNAGKYIEFRSMALAELSGVNPLHYHYASYSASEREFYRENAEAVNTFVKEQQNEIFY